MKWLEGCTLAGGESSDIHAAPEAHHENKSKNTPAELKGPSLDLQKLQQTGNLGSVGLVSTSARLM